MKWFSFSKIIFILFIFGCAHNPTPISSPSSPQPQQIREGSSLEDRLESPPASSKSEGESIGDVKKEVVEGEGRSQGKVDELNSDYVGDEEGVEAQKAVIADPLEPFNRAMYHFNDKLYFWVLKPVAQGYGKVVPEVARVGVRNFFTNLTTPVRFVNSLLQANFSGAFSEVGRFLINTIWGLGGLLDLASHEDIGLRKQDGDFGQTLGFYGLGPGFYINWPVLGPSSTRDTVGLVGDFFLHPFTFLDVAWDVSTGARAYEKVNATSLSIGDYESLKTAAIDPYVAIRDAYFQYRLDMIKRGGTKKTSPTGVSVHGER